MKSAGDRLELAFVADRGETARLISDKSAALTSQLHDAGIGLGGIDISIRPVGPGRERGRAAWRQAERRLPPDAAAPKLFRPRQAGPRQ